MRSEPAKSERSHSSCQAKVLMSNDGMTLLIEVLMVRYVAFEHRRRGPIRSVACSCRLQIKSFLQGGGREVSFFLLFPPHSFFLCFLSSTPRFGPLTVAQRSFRIIHIQPVIIVLSGASGSCACYIEPAFFPPFFLYPAAAVILSLFSCK